MSIHPSRREENLLGDDVGRGAVLVGLVAGAGLVVRVARCLATNGRLVALGLGPRGVAAGRSHRRFLKEGLLPIWW